MFAFVEGESITDDFTGPPCPGAEIHHMHQPDNPRFPGASPWPVWCVELRDLDHLMELAGWANRRGLELVVASRSDGWLSDYPELPALHFDTPAPG